jgi:adenylyltransferase/sulfurtransferase
LVGTIQATEAIKLHLGIGASLAGRLLLIDALRLEFRTVKVRRDPRCPACGTREIRALIDYDEFCGGAPRREANSAAIPEMSPADLAARRKNGQALELIDVRESYEVAMESIPGARHIALGELEAAIPSLDRTRPTVVYCKSGVRSAHAVLWLQAAGFEQVWNLAGGIVRWNEDVRP